MAVRDYSGQPVKAANYSLTPGPSPKERGEMPALIEAPVVDRLGRLDQYWQQGSGRK